MEFTSNIYPVLLESIAPPTVITINKGSIILFNFKIPLPNTSIFGTKFLCIDFSICFSNIIISAGINANTASILNIIDLSKTLPRSIPI